MNRDSMIASGIAVYQVGDGYETTEAGEPLSDQEKAKWFVSVPADSPMAATVQDIPLADTEVLAWEYAGRHYGFAQGVAND